MSLANFKFNILTPGLHRGYEGHQKEEKSESRPPRNRSEATPEDVSATVAAPVHAIPDELIETLQRHGMGRLGAYHFLTRPSTYEFSFPRGVKAKAYAALFVDLRGGGYEEAAVAVLRLCPELKRPVVLQLILEPKLRFGPNASRQVGRILKDAANQLLQSYQLEDFFCLWNKCPPELVTSLFEGIGPEFLETVLRRSSVTSREKLLWFLLAGSPPVEARDIMDKCLMDLPESVSATLSRHIAFLDALDSVMRCDDPAIIYDLVLRLCGRREAATEINASKLVDILKSLHLLNAGESGGVRKFRAAMGADCVAALLQACGGTTVLRKLLDFVREGRGFDPKHLFVRACGSKSLGKEKRQSVIASIFCSHAPEHVFGNAPNSVVNQVVRMCGDDERHLARALGDLIAACRKSPTLLSAVLNAVAEEIYACDDDLAIPAIIYLLLPIKDMKLLDELVNALFKQIFASSRDAATQFFVRLMVDIEWMTGAKGTSLMRSFASSSELQLAFAGIKENGEPSVNGPLASALVSNLRQELCALPTSHLKSISTQETVAVFLGMVIERLCSSKNISRVKNAAEVREATRALIEFLQDHASNQKSPIQSCAAKQLSVIQPHLHNFDAVVFHRENKEEVQT